MSIPKLHHYVSQFYLKRFSDAEGCLWVWDKLTDAVFRAKPDRVAAETHFYALPYLAEHGFDPLELERQLSNIEMQAALVTDQWVEWLPTLDAGQRIPIPEENRKAIALFIATQYLRTADTRELLCALAKANDLTAAGRARLHSELLWNDATVYAIRDRIKESIWAFGRNTTAAPFVASDNPVAFRTPDNRQWLRLGILSPGMYAVYPLSPALVMYCYEPEHWNKLARFDSCLSPVTFCPRMVEDENSGQIFMASRFVFSPINDFTHARQFAKTIGTNTYAPPEYKRR